MVRKIENLKIFNLSYDFLLKVYEILKILPESEFRNIYSQLQRAATSIVLNIVEGASNRSNKVFLNHLQYSFGSCKEVKILLMLCLDLNYIDEQKYSELANYLDILTASIFKFMNTVNNEIEMKKENYSLNKNKLNFRNIVPDFVDNFSLNNIQ
ncbi:MAG: four helix bundle protein [Candidatus Woesearchaeota archaeon]